MPLRNVSNDPGYETLLARADEKSEAKPTIEREPSKLSDYDPNYEVVKRPSASNSHSAGTVDDGYAKVKQMKNTTNEDDAADGYSKIKGDIDSNSEIIDNNSSDGRNLQRICAVPGYCTIADIKSDSDNDNYASILETRNEVDRNLQEDADSDHYASIAERVDSAVEQEPEINNLQFPAISIDNELAQRPQELSVITPTSISSRSFLNVSSINSSIYMTTTSTISSQQTPSSSSQYESFTGSETDPNYESVCYLNSSSTQENSYERLQTDVSDTQPSSSPLLSTGVSTTNSSPSETSAINEPSTIHHPSHSKENLSGSSDPSNILLNDYFHV